jgi:hypothetical protein
MRGLHQTIEKLVNVISRGFLECSIYNRSAGLSKYRYQDLIQ